MRVRAILSNYIAIYYNIQRENCRSRGALWRWGERTDMSQAGKTSEPAVECTNVPTQTDIVVDIEEISQEKVGTRRRTGYH